jgi:3-hydroxybutyrate dehydrogenase
LIADQIRARADAIGVEVTEGGRQLLMEKQPSLEFVTPEQLGALVCFLCTDAAKQLTGATIPVDGGWTAQ